MRAKILSVLHSVAPEVDFCGSDDFLRDGLIDSFDVILITTALEEAFSISIPGHQVTPENYSSIEQLAGLINQCPRGVKL